MFSEINKIYGRPNRRAENTDTRQEITRHDPDDPRSKKDDDDEGAHFDEQDVDAVVSVRALQAFLKSFLKGREGIAPSVAQTKEETQQDNPPESVAKIRPKTKTTTEPAAEDSNDAHAAVIEGQDKKAAEGDKAEVSANPAALRAANAYGARSGQSQTSAPPSSDPHSASVQNAVDMLAGEDIRMIYDVMEMLSQLDARGISDIHIIPRDTFLEGLAYSARAALEGH